MLSQLFFGKIPKRTNSQVKRVWADTELPLVSYKEAKDVFILGDLEEVLAAIEDSSVIMSTVAGSRFVAPLPRWTSGARTCCSHPQIHPTDHRINCEIITRKCHLRRSENLLGTKFLMTCISNW